MSKEYTKQEILQKLEQTKESKTVYLQNELFNDKRKTLDTKEYYTEVIAEWLYQNLDAVMTIPSKTRKSSYRVPTHDGKTPRESSNRQEERIAMKMFNQRNLPFLGYVLDYQTPLRDKISDPFKAVDLLVFDKDKSVLRLLELKSPKNENDTMLGCVIQGNNYLNTVDTKKLLHDFELPPATTVLASPFVAYNGFQHNEFKEDRPHLKALMKALNSTPYFYEKIGDQFHISM